MANQPVNIALPRVARFVGELAKVPLSVVTKQSVIGIKNDASLPADIRALATGATVGTMKLFSAGHDTLGIIDIMGSQIDTLRERVGALQTLEVDLESAKTASDQLTEQIRSKDAWLSFFSRTMNEILELTTGVKAKELNADNIKQAVEKIRRMNEDLKQLLAELGLPMEIDKAQLALRSAQMLKSDLAAARREVADERQAKLDKAAEDIREIRRLEALLRAAQAPQTTAKEADTDILTFSDPADLRRFINDNPNEDNYDILIAIRNYLGAIPHIGNILVEQVDSTINDGDNLMGLLARINGKITMMLKNTIMHSQDEFDQINAFAASFDTSEGITLSTTVPAAATPSPTSVVPEPGRQNGSIEGAYYSIRTDVGGRKANEDCAGYARRDDGTELFLVADGMGGHGAGEVASRMSVENTIALWKAGHDLEIAAKLSHEEVVKAARENPAYEGMGTTLVATEISHINSMMKTVSIGDSRIKMLGKGENLVLTMDHSLKYMTYSRTVDLETLYYLSNEDADNKYYSPKIALNDEELDKIESWEFGASNVIASAIGQPTMFMDVTSIPLTEDAEGTWLLKYSDGALSGRMTEREISDLAYISENLSAASGLIVKMAKQKETTDNVTVAAIRVPYALDLSSAQRKRFAYDADSSQLVEIDGSVAIKKSALAQNGNGGGGQQQSPWATQQPVIPAPPPTLKREANQVIKTGWVSKLTAKILYHDPAKEMEQGVIVTLLKKLIEHITSKSITVHIASNIQASQMLNFLPYLEAALNEKKTKGRTASKDIYLYWANNNTVGVLFDHLPDKLKPYFD